MGVSSLQTDVLDLRVLGQAAGLGLVTGMRSMLGLKMLAASARRGAFDERQGPLWEALRSSAMSPVLSVLATGELIADKLPFMPSRLAPGPLAVRLVLGALVGAAVGARGDDNRTRILGAALGAGAAAAGAFAGNRARAWLGQKTKLAGLIEDGIALSLSAASKPS